MSNFRYQVIDSAGKKSEGIIEAASIGEATRKLKTDGKYISSLTLDRGSGLANMTIGSPAARQQEGKEMHRRDLRISSGRTFTF